MPPWLIPIILAGISAVSAGVQGSAQRSEAKRAERERREAAETQRARVEEVMAQIDKRMEEQVAAMRDADFTDVGSGASAQYGQADRAAQAQAAAAGVQGGAAQSMRNEVLANAIAQLSQFKTAEQRAREQAVGALYAGRDDLEARLLGDDSFDVPEGELPGFIDTLWAGLLGGLGGLGESASEYLTNPDAFQIPTTEPGTPATTGGGNPARPGGTTSREPQVTALRAPPEERQSAGFLMPAIASLVTPRNASIQRG